MNIDILSAGPIDSGGLIFVRHFKMDLTVVSDAVSDQHDVWHAWHIHGAELSARFLRLYPLGQVDRM